MTGDDFRRIEDQLGITLPERYTRLLRPFPIPYLRGNHDTDLWDDVDSLIDRNRELRTEFVTGHQPWPKHWFFIGDPMTACANAIDLRDPVAPVHWIDHCDLGTVKDASGTPLEDWLHRWCKDIRADLNKDGVDPEAQPEPESDVKPWPLWIRVPIVAGVLVAVGALLVFGLVSLFKDVVAWFRQ